MIGNKAVPFNVYPNSIPRRRSRYAITVSRRALIGIGVVAGVVCALFACLAGNFSTILLKQLRDAYTLHRITSERDALRASLQELEHEVVTLRIERSQGEAIDRELQANLQALNEVVQLAGSLGLVQQSTSREQKNARRTKEQHTSELRELARMLSGDKKKVVAVAPNRNGDGEDATRGLGGAEVECARGSAGAAGCAAADLKKEISFDGNSDITRALLTDTAQSIATTDPRIELISRISTVTRALRVMPIGSPVDGELTSGFGHRRSPFSRRTSFHEGVDISLPRGSNVFATADGVVVGVGFDGTYGWMVDIEHTPDLITRYAHLSRPLVKKGKTVQRGDRIALSGSSGRSTGPHLHYEVRYKSRARDPKPFLALAEKLRTVG